MAADITDKFSKIISGTTRPVATTLSAQKLIGATTASLTAATGWDTDTAVHGIMYRTDAGTGAKVAGSQIDWKATLSGTTLSNFTVTAGTDDTYAIGATVELAPTAAWGDDLVTGLLVEHNQDGTHNDVTADTVTATTITADEFVVAGASANNGWTVGLPTPDTVTYNGNRSYDLVFNGTDLTDTVSNGMRLKLTRTTAPPTQCTSLNGTTQYYSKTSPAGMTFTDDFVVSAWVKLSSYPSSFGSIASRYNGTSGWDMRIKSTGQIEMVGYNAGAANYAYLATYQSLPLNKWVHVAAQLDMSTFTVTATTCYAMIDGKDVPVSLPAKGGTAPTALIQAGNLEIGSCNGGTNLFPGKIAQVAVYNSKVTQATILASMNQTLTGSETNLVSAYTFNNSINDLSANANNLTASGGAGFATDSPFNSTEYGIITANSFSTDTTLTVQVPEGYAIPTSGGVSAVSYSTQDTPYGFPRDKGKWNIISWLNTVVGSTSTTQSDLFVIPAIPIGHWTTSVSGDMYTTGNAGATYVIYVSEATAGSVKYSAIGPSSIQNTVYVVTYGHYQYFNIKHDLQLTSATTYYVVQDCTGTTTSTGANGLAVVSELAYV